MFSKIRFSALAIATATMIGATSAANASLIGDTVSGTLGSATQTVTTQFTSPAVVGGGIEFSGVVTDVFNQIWGIDVDIAGSSFTVSITESTNPFGNGNVQSAAGIFDISLTNLDWLPNPGMITGVTLNNYSCVSAGLSCTAFGGGPDILNLSSGNDFINVSFDTIRDGEVYAFDISTVHVPEPGTLAIFGLGLAGLGFARRRKSA